MHKWSRFVHKWLGLIVGIQLAIWIVGGLAFALIPFQPIIKGTAYVEDPATKEVSMINPLYPADKIIQQIKNVKSLKVIYLGDKLTYKVIDSEDNISMWDAQTGEKLPQPTEKEIRTYSNKIYIGNGKIKDIKLIKESESKRLGIVDELYGKVNVWQVSYDDKLENRLYFEESTGEYLKIRNNAWVLFDFFWRLHVMDYSDGENFNNPILRIASILAVILTISGFVLLFYSRLIKKRKREVGVQYNQSA